MNKEEPHYYMVMKLLNEVNIMNHKGVFVKGQKFIPVFENYEEALEHSENGKYDIIPLEMKNEQLI